MEKFQSLPYDGTLQSERTVSPHRFLSKSYPPQRPMHGEHGGPVDVKLADHMDEDEARWMSTLESSRAASPIQGAAPSQTKTANDQLEVLSQSDQRGHSKSAAPSVSPLSLHRHSPTTSSQGHESQRQSTKPSTGLTALPQPLQALATPSFAQRVFITAKADLLYNYTEHGRWPWRRAKTYGAIDITTPQKMQKYVIQQKLIAHVRALGERERWLEIGIGQTMREYCQILRDLEYMEKRSAARGKYRDPFLITTQRPLEAQLLEESGIARQSPGARSARHDIAGYIRHNDRCSPCWTMLRRLKIMLAIAAAMITPFLVSELTSGDLPRIIVVCACIVAFAAAVAACSGKGDQTLHPSMLLTLIYAAALIIFLGTDHVRRKESEQSYRLQRSKQ